MQNEISVGLGPARTCRRPACKTPRDVLRKYCMRKTRPKHAIRTTTRNSTPGATGTASATTEWPAATGRSTSSSSTRRRRSGPSAGRRGVAVPVSPCEERPPAWPDTQAGHVRGLRQLREHPKEPPRGPGDQGRRTEPSARRLGTQVWPRADSKPRAPARRGRIARAPGDAPPAVSSVLGWRVSRDSRAARGGAPRRSSRACHPRHPACVRGDPIPTRAPPTSA